MNLWTMVVATWAGSKGHVPPRRVLYCLRTVFMWLDIKAGRALMDKHGCGQRNSTVVLWGGATVFWWRRWCWEMMFPACCGVGSVCLRPSHSSWGQRLAARYKAWCRRVIFPLTNRVRTPGRDWALLQHFFFVLGECAIFGAGLSTVAHYAWAANGPWPLRGLVVWVLVFGYAMWRQLLPWRRPARTLDVRNVGPGGVLMLKAPMTVVDQIVGEVKAGYITADQLQAAITVMNEIKARVQHVPPNHKPPTNVFGTDGKPLFPEVVAHVKNVNVIGGTIEMELTEHGHMLLGLGPPAHPMQVNWRSPCLN